mmetsp:Transcript_39498/g.77137  ORF Transcript_39498/g.77137 Transcript_39498/m.77137 type:complete len:396 (+) Transcript_39498:184-1371(+)
MFLSIDNPHDLTMRCIIHICLETKNSLVVHKSVVMTVSSRMGVNSLSTQNWKIIVRITLVSTSTSYVMCRCLHYNISVETCPEPHICSQVLRLVVLKTFHGHQHLPFLQLTNIRMITSRTTIQNFSTVQVSKGDTVDIPAWFDLDSYRHPCQSLAVFGIHPLLLAKLSHGIGIVQDLAICAYSQTPQVFDSALLSDPQAEAVHRKPRDRPAGTLDERTGLAPRVRRVRFVFRESLQRALFQHRDSLRKLPFLLSGLLREVVVVQFRCRSVDADETVRQHRGRPQLGTDVICAVPSCQIELGHLLLVARVGRLAETIDEIFCNFLNPDKFLQIAVLDQFCSCGEHRPYLLFLKLCQPFLQEDDGIDLLLQLFSRDGTGAKFQLPGFRVKHRVAVEN